MHESGWLKYGAIALAAVGLLAIIGLAAGADEGVEGETWAVAELNSGSGATAPLAGTLMTALFDDGSLNGTAGCNSYFTSYALDGDSISLGPIGSTRAFCNEPGGIMDQEVEYLTLLETADRYERDGDQLTLFSGDAAVITYGAVRPELYSD